MTQSFGIIDRNTPRDPGQKTRFETQEIPKTLGNHREAAKLYQPDDDLVGSVNAALLVGAPLLVTGEPGTGKTQVAYWAAYHLGIEDRLYKLDVRSTSVANDLFYRFDAVAYFHAANDRSRTEPLDPKNFRNKQALWKALESPRSIVLIDEVDKAQRDFPNDLLQALDQYEFFVPETGEKIVRQGNGAPPLVIITSNSERRLPEPFLRRCIFHHIEFSEDLVRRAVNARASDFPNLEVAARDAAVKRFFELRKRELRKKPATAELLVWLILLSARSKLTAQEIESARLGDLPAIGALIKDHEDRKEL
ncbi:MAG TPA: MoxR family ATPase [Polyangium sp.]|nr:MoxR family ATPase [Polyangium sp.]